jgi:hypothetical protein
MFLSEAMQNMRLPTEMWEHLAPLVNIAAAGQDEQAAAMEPLYNYGRQIQRSAKAKQAAFQSEIEKPLPINAGLMALNRAVGSFAQALSPRGDFLHRADQRREFEVGQMKERRLEQLKTQEADMMAEMQRAQEFGDFEAKTRVTNSAQKINAMRQAMMQGMEGYNKLKDELRLAYQKRIDELGKIAFEYSLKIKTGDIKDPRMAAVLKAKENAFEATKAMALKRIDSADNSMLPPEEQNKLRNSAVADMQKATEQYLTEINQLFEPPAEGGTPQYDRAAGPQPAIDFKIKELVENSLHNGVVEPGQILDVAQKSLEDPNGTIWQDLGVPYGSVPSKDVLGMMRKEIKATIEPVRAKIGKLKTLKTQLWLEERAGIPGFSRKEGVKEYNKLVAEVGQFVKGAEPIAEEPEPAKPVKRAPQPKMATPVYQTPQRLNSSLLVKTAKAATIEPASQPLGILDAAQLRRMLAIGAGDTLNAYRIPGTVIW